MFIHSFTLNFLVPNYAFIFGSFVNDNFNDESDIDIAIHLDNCILSTEEYMSLVNQLTSSLKRDVDIVIINEATPLIKYQLIKYGQLLFSRNNECLNNFRVNTIFEYEDTKYLRDYSHKKMIEKLEKEVFSNG